MAVKILKKSALKLRHELKQVINREDDMILSSRLCHLFGHDEHADRDGSYRITSLYFDTPDDRALRQKKDGVDRREKFRLRYYGSDTSFIRLEKKIKINGLCAKDSAVLSRKETEKLLAGEYAFMAESENALLVEFYSKIRTQLLRPKTVVVYDREAFVYSPANVRITLDRDIRTTAGTGCMNFLLCEPALLKTEEKGITVFEIKYDEFLPEIVRAAVQLQNSKTGAYSKYASCRRFD